MSTYRDFLMLVTNRVSQESPYIGQMNTFRTFLANCLPYFFNLYDIQNCAKGCFCFRDLSYDFNSTDSVQ